MDDESFVHTHNQETYIYGIIKNTYRLNINLDYLHYIYGHGGNDYLYGEVQHFND